MDRINAQQLAELPSPGVRFFAQDAGTGEVLAAACPARRELELKVGAQVGRAVVCVRGRSMLVPVIASPSVLVPTPPVF